jgi:hypothetical protein
MLLSCMNQMILKMNLKRSSLYAASVVNCALKVSGPMTMSVSVVSGFGRTVPYLQRACSVV